MSDPERHNHFTRDVKAAGECPACDRYHTSQRVVHTSEEEYGITWSGRMHRVKSGAEVKVFHTGSHTKAACSDNISVLVDPAPHSAGPGWDMVAQQLHNFRTGGHTPRLPLCKRCFRDEMPGRGKG